MPDPTPPRPPEPKLELNLGCLLGIASMVWLALALWSVPSLQEPVPWSVLVQQARAGNVARLQVEGESLTGAFRAAVTLPDPRRPPPAARRVERFRTTAPTTLGPSDLLEALEATGTRVDVLPTPTSGSTRLLLFALPILAVLLLVLSNRSRRPEGLSLFSFGRSHPRVYDSPHPEVTFQDVAGCDEAKSELLTEIDFLRHPDKYHALGARIPRGVLLVGPPGTGKTLLARAVAGEAGVPFFSVSASEFVEIFVGVGASRVRDLFAKAKAAAPAILFLDELDAVGRRRGAGIGGANDEREQTLNQLLVEMDGFDERQDVIVLAATNRPDILDHALLRPGRFDRQVEVPLPDRAGREAILHVHARALPLAPDVDLAAVAAGTPGFSGADLANLCNEAALLAARGGHARVGTREFEEAQDKLVLGGVRSLLLKPEERRAIAFHEAGHALVAWLTPEADPVHKVSIIPRGRSLGATEQKPADDRYHCSRAWLGARLATLLAGRAAEELVFGEASTGAENDLQEATRLARRMVSAWGMGSLGPVSFEGEHPHGEATASRIDEDVQRLLEESLDTARGLLEEHREELERLAAALLERETLDQSALVVLLGEMRGVRSPAPEPRAAVEPAAPRPSAGVVAIAWADDRQGRGDLPGLP